MKFDWYYEPTSVNECVEILKEYGSEAKLLAGGTDLVVRLRSRAQKVKALVSLNAMPELSRIQKTEDGLHIGAMTKLMDITKSEMFTGSWMVVKKSAGNVSSMQVRNVATIGGNTCNASPSADTVPGMIASDAIVRIAGTEGERALPLEQFFTGPGKTALKKDEMVVGFKLPDLGPGNGAAYKKYAIRGDSDIAIVGVAARLKLSQDGIIEDARVVLGAVAPTPIRVPSAEQMLIGQVLTDELAAKAAQAASDFCTPITDARATKEYRKEMVRVWTQYVLKEAHSNAQ
ncbi:MAG: xanthine dehydrogenase family protein subunit M [Acidaminobacter sp.]|uniref:FAD binding domain-containing protein n=1 Tax=Acidaminobacter sp. TaxID=1872102 RepID=UPI001384FAC9|nr:xanthine dehydrogenase family protein subunit M [Acidaminobacter sp.]MZQ98988.1 xanthine dehydrogenase family protein subunit M [Acidaminobacter sp.]